METTEKPMTLTYEQCLERGFKRYDSHDPVFLLQNGYEYFIVKLQIGNRTFEWDIHTHQVNYFLNRNIVKRGVSSSEFEKLIKESRDIKVFCNPEYRNMYGVKFIADEMFTLTWYFTNKKDGEKFKELLLKAK